MEIQQELQYIDLRSATHINFPVYNLLLHLVYSYDSGTYLLNKNLKKLINLKK